MLFLTTGLRVTIVITWLETFFQYNLHLPSYEASQFQSCKDLKSLRIKTEKRVIFCHV